MPKQTAKEPEVTETEACQIMQAEGLPLADALLVLAGRPSSVSLTEDHVRTAARRRREDAESGAYPFVSDRASEVLE